MNGSVDTLRRDQRALLDELSFAGANVSRPNAIKCPFHEDRNPSAGVYQSQDGVWRYKCHGCGQGGDIYDIRAVIEGKTVGEVLKEARSSSDDDMTKAPTAQPSPIPTAANLDACADAVLASIRRSDGHADWIIAHIYDYHRADGTLYAAVVRAEPPEGGDKTVRPVHAMNGGWAIGDPAPWTPYRVDQLKPGRVFIVEGEKAADAGVRIGLNVITWAHGAKAVAKTDWSALTGRDVALLPDNDDPGRDAMQTLAEILAEQDCTVRMLILDGLSEHGDLYDWLETRDAHDPDELCQTLQQLSQDTPAWQPPPPEEATKADSPSGKLPVIEVTTAEHAVIEATIHALRADPDLYQRGGELVRIVRGDSSDGVHRTGLAPAIRSAPAAHLRERITRHAAFIRLDARSKTMQPTHPPGWLTPAIEARGEWSGIRTLTRVSDVPVLRPDGSIWQTPGYDAVTGVLYEPLDGVTFEPIPDHLTVDDARVAADELLEVVCDFPFSEDIHRSAWLAAALTPLARTAFTGPAPGFVFDSNVRGAGKTLAATVAAAIAVGGDIPASGYAHDSDEMRKRITAIAMAGDPLVLLDNIDGPFGNDALDRALTATRWRDRKLGENTEVDLPLLTTWYATGNNVEVAADASRRLIHILLDCLEERPEQRQNFTHPDLLQYVQKRRPRLVRAALLLLAAYLRAGQPSQGLIPLGSFEGWSRLVREATVWVGLPDPCQTQQRLVESSDSTVDTLRQLLDAWNGAVGVHTSRTVAELIGSLYPEDRNHTPDSSEARALRAALEQLADTPSGMVPTSRKVGKRLHKFRRRVADGRYLDMDSGRTSAGHRWRLHQSQAGGSVYGVDSADVSTLRV